MNICVITPLYPVAGRNDIKTDTQAVHLLLKYLSGEHNIHVFNVNRISPREILKGGVAENDKLFNQYDYRLDGIEASLLRYRAYPKQKHLTKKQICVVRVTIKRVLAEKNFYPDVVIVHLPSSFPNLLEGIYQDVRHVAVLHRTDINVIGIIPTLADKINKNYEVIVGRSQSVIRMAEKLGLRIENRIVFSGIPSDFLLSNYEHQFNRFEEKVNLVYVGKLIKRKHPEYILSLCEDLNLKGIYATATVIGDGPLKNKLKSQVRKLKYGCKVEMVSFLPRNQVQNKMRYSDIFILPSVNETLGLVYLEAMAAGCITIGVINEGIDGVIVNNQNGYLVEPENYDALLKCILFIIKQNPETIQAMSWAAIITANECPEEKASENYLSIMQG